MFERSADGQAHYIPVLATDDCVNKAVVRRFEPVLACCSFTHEIYAAALASYSRRPGQTFFPSSQLSRSA